MTPQKEDRTGPKTRIIEIAEAEALEIMKGDITGPSIGFYVDADALREWRKARTDSQAGEAQ